MRTRIESLLAVFILALITVAALTSVALAAVDVSDPGSTADELLGMLRSGRYLPAVGAVLVLLVTAVRRGLLKGWGPAQTKLGGYIVGFGTATLLFVGVALAASAPVTAGLILNALGAGLAASGGWEAFLDVLSFAKSKKGSS